MSRHRNVRNINLTEEINSANEVIDDVDDDVLDSSSSHQLSAASTSLFKPTRAAAEIKKSTENSSMDSLLPAKSVKVSPSTHRLNLLTAIRKAEPLRRKKPSKESPTKEQVNLVVVGHVDAGKSTLMGHILCKLGRIDQRTLHKYKQESTKLGKGSFAFAWVLDETDEERLRGVTMDIARTYFETASKRIGILDAPGHKDFIPNMINGVAQADAALLVVNANVGEFETGFERGGQTREHAILLRSFGVSQLLVAVNQLDKVGWSSARYTEVVEHIKLFLEKNARFSEVIFVPCSGLAGINLTERVQSESELGQWYKGPCIIELIDSLKIPQRITEGALRAPIIDVLKFAPSQLTASLKIESGYIMKDDKLFVMPNGEMATIKVLLNEEGNSENVIEAGTHALAVLTGQFEIDAVQKGHVLAFGGEGMLIPGRDYLARVVVFDVAPLMQGLRAELYGHSLCEPVTIKKLNAIIHKSSGKVIKTNPRLIDKNSSGLIQIHFDHEVALETYAQCKALGRIILRSAGKTVAAGIIDERL